MVQMQLNVMIMNFFDNQGQIVLQMLGSRNFLQNMSDNVVVVVAVDVHYPQNVSQSR